MYYSKASIEILKGEGKPLVNTQTIIGHKNLLGKKHFSCCNILRNTYPLFKECGLRERDSKIFQFEKRFCNE